MQNTRIATQDRTWTRDQVTELLKAQVQACVKQQQSGKLVSWTELVEIK